jgi:anti-sigma regulatory factor (Ser/Thr protein kinase)
MYDQEVVVSREVSSSYLVDVPGTGDPGIRQVRVSPRPEGVNASEYFAVVGEVRKWLVAVLATLPLPPSGSRVNEAVLVLSELITNAVLYSYGVVTVTLTRSPDGRIILRVADSSPEMPVMEAQPSETNTGGRGYLIATALGLVTVEPYGSEGKVVEWMGQAA